MPNSDSLRFYLKTAFDYEMRNIIDIRISQLRKIDELNEDETDELKQLELIKEYLLKRIGEMA